MLYWTVLLIGAASATTVRLDHHESLDFKSAKGDARWGINSTHIEMELTYPTKGWVAFGLSPHGQMDDADFLFGYVNDTTKEVVVQVRILVVWSCQNTSCEWMFRRGFVTTFVIGSSRGGRPSHRSRYDGDGYPSRLDEDIGNAKQHSHRNSRCTKTPNLWQEGPSFHGNSSSYKSEKYWSCALINILTLTHFSSWILNTPFSLWTFAILRQRRPVSRWKMQRPELSQLISAVTCLQQISKLQITNVKRNSSPLYAASCITIMIHSFRSMVFPFSRMNSRAYCITFVLGLQLGMC